MSDLERAEEARDRNAGLQYEEHHEQRTEDRMVREVERYQEALKHIADMQQHALEIIRGNGFVFERENIGTEPGNWSHLAFTLYTEICHIDTIARAALEIPLGEDRGLE